MLHGSPWIYWYSLCHQMITQQQLTGPQGLSGVTSKSHFFSQPMLA